MPTRLLVLAALLTATACDAAEPATAVDAGPHADAAPDDTVAPDYDRVFPDDRVQRLDLAIDADTYATMHANMVDLYGEPGTGGGGPPPGGASDVEPDFVPVTVTYDGTTWHHVGMRYKGNSSLRTAWRQGVLKLPFRLDFDEFEDTYPETLDQRFFGFKKLTFSSGFKDASLMREKVCAELFRAAGVPAARGAFYEIYLDTGDGAGPRYMGLYTAVEDPSNRFLDSQFTDDSGNLYKPDGPAAAWTTFDPDDFDKKTNEDAADWTDVELAIAALHGSRADAAAWRAELEARVDVDGFLRWLAGNQAMMNWDTYGVMTHNYYVYGDPADGGRLRWIPWDLNECLLPATMARTVLLDEVGTSWPLIRYLLDDPVYRARYLELLDEFAAGPFAADAVKARLRAVYDLIHDSAMAEQAPYTNLTSTAEFERSLTDRADALEPHVDARHAAVENALQ